MYSSNPELELQDYLTRLMKAVQMLDSKLELYLHLMNRTQDRVREMSIAPAFFGIVLNTLLSDIIISLSRLYDGQRSERNLIRFLDFAQQNRDLCTKAAYKTRRNLKRGDWRLDRHRRISRATINSHRRRIAEYDAALTNLKTWRDKLYAHSDEKYFKKPGLLKTDAPIKYGQLRGLVKLAGKILNTYSVAFDGNFTQIRYLNTFDVDKLLDILHKHMQSLE